MSWDLLKRFIESDHFNNDPFLSVAYLSRYADHVGIHYVLCSKLRRFSYEEIEFFLPQLCHLVISVDNESMALEEFIIDLCEESVNGALLTFWLFQTYLHDLSGNPQSGPFKTCRRVFNKLQHIIFAGFEPSRREKLSENILPVSVLASFVLASVATPFLPSYAGPLAIAQARRPGPTGETISDASQTQRIIRSHTVGPLPPRSRRDRQAQVRRATGDARSRALHAEPKPSRSATSASPAPRAAEGRRLSQTHRPARLDIQRLGPRHSSSSLPDIGGLNVSSPATPSPGRRSPHPVGSGERRSSPVGRPLTPSSLPPRQKASLLRSNYFRSETQFLRALEDISNRLVIVPKPARLSALRAELALIAQDLPAEVDVPVICPATLPDGSAGKSRHHRIVRLNPAEATVLNSAEKVPYLLMVEVLREDFDFSPDTPQNQQLLAKLISEKGMNRRRIFDLTDSPRSTSARESIDNGADSVFEPATGDLGSSPRLTSFDDDAGTLRVAAGSGRTSVISQSWNANPLSAKSSSSLPRTSDMSNGLGGGPAAMAPSGIGRAQTMDQADVSALATHMRTAARMLAQLDSSESKRPKVEVAAIKAKIIASMQSLEEQSFSDERQETPTFDTILATANPLPEDLDDESIAEANLKSRAGADRMENDQMTGGVERRGDAEDPSAATFGEKWSAKKERIRRSSPYGSVDSWDLLSVIVKTGADLRQEAFACQLIQVCWKIWQDAGVPVWVKRMRILVTGESSGLIETITNGVSLHSIKRSLTLANIAAGRNPRNRIASLKDHFVKSFGEPDTESYKTAEGSFVRSLAAYSVISYILQLKDRHNGNILIDEHGNIIHIDFGFMLSNSPGSVGFEAAPFKLTQEYIDVLGGPESEGFKEFTRLCKQAFQALRKSAESIFSLVEMMGKQSKMPCFSAGVDQVTSALRQRFQLQLSQEAAEQYMETDLIGKSLGSYYTRLYDTFQYRSQGIY
ncbi:MAG: Phosphatidylinositol 4-kinase pik1alpha (PI4-kinase)(PtdIns-4-kinase) [Thelocarpon impressellum]|nr:MAG: Phosphatidylinositol 4-kinase pik1alpha (PI4-kinase)(PtdIns-4-kinase) [Thelocarpon impressellum]